MKNIHLVGGILEKKYGRTHSYAVKSVAACIRLLEANYPGFKRDLAKGFYKIIVGDSIETGDPFVMEEQVMMNYGIGNFYIVSVLAGSASSGKSWGMIIAGIIIIAFCWWNPLGWAAATQLMVGMMGASMVMGGVSLLLAPALLEDMNDRGDDRTTFTFGGAVNRIEQGRPRPLIFGRFMVGSYVVESSLKSKNT